MQRRPSPGEIRLLAEREVKPLGEELARRRRINSQEKAAKAEQSKRIVTPEERARILAERGFTEERLAAVMRHPLARTMEEATAPIEVKPHPSEISENHRAALAASRATNPLCNPGGKP